MPAFELIYIFHMLNIVLIFTPFIVKDTVLTVCKQWDEIASIHITTT